MSTFYALREKPALSGAKKGDLLVLFGELFQRGYGNGLVEEAEKRGLKIIRATVGRRDKDGQLRALTSDELSSLPSPVINIPLEAGFDLEPDDSGTTLVDELKDVKLSDWESFKLTPDHWMARKEKAKKRFRHNVEIFLKELENHWSPGQNILFAHLMAGGVPRAKIVMPLMNRAFKGTGERYLSSEKFWNSSIGKLCSDNFFEVTAETFWHLIELSTPLRQKVEKSQGRVSYLAYGYHGTEVWNGKKYEWQTYTPYLQGWAKLRLEKISEEFYKKGIHCCVYNCPEILTNSSSIFQGVEVSLYPLLLAFRHHHGRSKKSQEIETQCLALLKSDFSWAQFESYLANYLNSPLTREYCQFSKWPQHSGQNQLEAMLLASEDLISWHQDPKKLITTILSEVVFEACGYLMFHDSWNPSSPVAWIGHDAILAATDTSTPAL